MQRSREGAAVIVAGLLLLLLAPLLYVAATGPLVWLNGTGRIQITPDSWIARMYWPLEVAVNHCEPLETALQAYLSLWEPTRKVPISPPAAQYVAPAPAAPAPPPAQASPAPGQASPSVPAVPQPSAATSTTDAPHPVVPPALVPVEP